MIPVEVIVRRLATGSFLKTHPQYKEGNTLFPLVVEFTLKSDEQGDPLVTEAEMVTSGIADWSRIETMKSLARRAFLILEKAWKRINVTLVDFKVEFGISQAGDLVLADVIDNDSWRLWPNGEKRLMKDKQVYRNMSIPGPGQITEEQRRIVLENYTWVAEQSKKLVDSIATAQPKSGPLVGVIMGSQSDWSTMQHATSLLEELGVAYEAKIVSAHRTPSRLCAYARSAKQRGLKVIIAGAGGAAHLPGMTASMTPLPVLGVPVKTSTLNGQDSLLSIVQMPRGIPVGTLAIGDSGAANAAILAASILAAHVPFGPFPFPPLLRSDASVSSHRPSMLTLQRHWTTSAANKRPAWRRSPPVLHLSFTRPPPQSVHPSLQSLSSLFSQALPSYYLGRQSGCLEEDSWPA
jgi:5-(carboxyamino)imidazole ribonucleotide mutase